MEENNFFLYKKTFFMYEMQFKINKPCKRKQTCP